MTDTDKIKHIADIAAAQAVESAEAPMTDWQRYTLANQLSYYDGLFGGAGFWPVPMTDQVAGGPTDDAILTEFFKPATIPGVAAIPDTSLSTYYTSLAVIVGALAYAVADLSERARRGLALGMLGVAVAAIVVFFALLYNDPAFYAVRLGNTLLWVLLVVVFAWVYVVLRKPKIRQP